MTQKCFSINSSCTDGAGVGVMHSCANGRDCLLFLGRLGGFQGSFSSGQPALPPEPWATWVTSIENMIHNSQRGIFEKAAHSAYLLLFSTNMELSVPVCTSVFEVFCSKLFHLESAQKVRFTLNRDGKMNGCRLLCIVWNLAPVVVLMLSVLPKLFNTKWDLG